MLKINDQGALLLMNAKKITIWIANSSLSVTNPVAQLLDSGNFVVRDENNFNADAYQWQSFDHPGDTLLPGMKLGWDLVKGLERNLKSWKSANDPSHGNYTCSISLVGYPQLVLQNGSVLHYRHGFWDSMQLNSMSTNTQSKDLTDKFVINENETYYKYGVWDRFIIMRMVLTLSGTLQLFTWNDQNQNWEIYFAVQKDACDRYALCGAYGSCDSTGCQCTAYAYMDITEGRSGCLIWFDELTDIGVKTSDSLDLYVKLAVFDLGGGAKRSRLKMRVGVIVVALLLGLYLKRLGSKRKDKDLSKSLDWLKRYSIIEGIARGLLYLHQNSRLRIIHGDLKVSNILLDYANNPKVSDFGLARTFGGSEIEVNTTKVAGTHGYMSLEYLIDGVFSIKSDVYSFGVVSVGVC
ncbi:G-type lectin S-receptor-like serine/threonine-protein kinase At4g27290 [Apium graveolens]|uniref:G-type lectin S-receptor-like serine/threonine-protein kinase At4g27290 n=1 Tax=Apium graveolens TaxID=4045 RepID=UPI003D7BF16F